MSQDKQIQERKENQAMCVRAIAASKQKFMETNCNSLNYKREGMFALQAIENNDFLLKIAASSPDAFKNAIINVAAIGLSLNPAEKLAYLIPRKGKVCLDISYIGLIRLATDTGSILWAKAELVYENDNFIYNGATEKPEFSTFNPFNRGVLQGVYCVAKTKDGDYLSGVMSLKECYEIRDRSEAWSRTNRQTGERTPSGPWLTDEGEMIKKTIIKRESKTWPKSDRTERLDTAIKVINEHEGINFDGLKICGMDVSDMVDDIDKVNKGKVERSLEAAIAVVDSDDETEGPALAKDIWSRLSGDEQIVLHKLLGQKKYGRKGYHTIFKQYIDQTPAIEGEIA